MVVGFVTTYAISAYHHWSGVNNIMRYSLSVSSTNNTDRHHDRTEILLKVALNTIRQTYQNFFFKRIINQEKKMDWMGAGISINKKINLRHMSSK